MTLLNTDDVGLLNTQVSQQHREKMRSMNFQNLFWLRWTELEGGSLCFLLLKLIQRQQPNLEHIYYF